MVNNHHDHVTDEEVIMVMLYQEFGLNTCFILHQRFNLYQFAVSAFYTGQSYIKIMSQDYSELIKVEVSVLKCTVTVLEYT